MDTASEAAGTLQSGRCHWCGYSLTGLALLGKCPECGTRYDQSTLHRLRPWPNASRICMRLGWPIVGLMFAGMILMIGRARGDTVGIVGLILAYAMIVSVAVNSYFQVRSMLRRSLPEGVRTRGPVAIWRRIGTTLCVMILLVFVGVPLALGVGCIILLTALD